MSTQLSGLLAMIRRFPFCAGCVAVTIICGGGSWFLWGEVQDLQVVHEDRGKEWEAMLSTLVGGSGQRQELATVREITRRIESNLVVADDLAVNLQYLYKLEEKAKARLSDPHQLNSPITDNSPLFCRVPYTFRVSGTFEQVGAFLLAIETGPRVMRITSFTFSRTGPGISLDLGLEFLGKK